MFKGKPKIHSGVEQEWSWLMHPPQSLVYHCDCGIGMAHRYSAAQPSPQDEDSRKNIAVGWKSSDGNEAAW